MSASSAVHDVRISIEIARPFTRDEAAKLPGYGDDLCNGKRVHRTLRVIAGVAHCDRCSAVIIPQPRVVLALVHDENKAVSQFMKDEAGGEYQTTTFLFFCGCGPFRYDVEDAPKVIQG